MNENKQQIVLVNPLLTRVRQELRHEIPGMATPEIVRRLLIEALDARDHQRALSRKSKKATSSEKLDDLASKMAGHTLAADPEGLGRVITSIETALDEVVIRPEGRPTLVPKPEVPVNDYKYRTFGVNPIVQEEIKAILYDPAALGPPISFLSPDLVTKPESELQAQPEPEKAVKSLEDEPEETTYTPEELGQDPLDGYDFDDLLK